MKKINELLADTENVSKYITNGSVTEKDREKLKKMISLYNKNPRKFMGKYINSGEYDYE